MGKNRGGRESGSGLGRTLIKEKKKERRSKKQTDGWVSKTLTRGVETAPLLEFSHPRGGGGSLYHFHSFIRAN